MNFNDLNIYKTIYETKSINKAAKELGYAQSNLTARLKAIEHELNSTLFVRSNQGLAPTDNGNKVYRFAVKALRNWQKLQDTLVIRKTILSSELLVNFLIAKKKFFITDYAVTIKKSNQLESELTQRYYDVVVTFNQFDLPNYRLKQTANLPACFLKGKQEDESTCPIAINSDLTCPFRKLTLKLCPDKARLLEIDSLETIMQLVKRGEAVALLPQYLIDNDYQKVNDHNFNIPYYCYQYQI